MTDSKKETLFSSLMAQYLHQNDLVWGRAKNLYFVQSGVLAGQFYLFLNNYHAMGISLLTLGFLVTSGLLYVLFRDIECRNCNVDLIKELGQELDQRFVLNPYRPIKGDHIISGTYILFLMIDLALIVFNIKCNNP